MFGICVASEAFLTLTALAGDSELPVTDPLSSQLLYLLFCELYT